MLFNYFQVLKNSSKMYQLNSTMHKWNFTPKFDTILVIYGYLQDSQQTVHLLSLFSLVESNGTMQINYVMQTRAFKQIHGDINYEGFP